MIFQRRVIEAKQSHGASLAIKARAKSLRLNMTETEKILWSKIRNKQQNGFYFRRQHPFNIYILDFYCDKASLAIEIDGEIHLRQKVYDEERTRFLESSGLKVLRFTNKDIKTRIGWVLKIINKQMTNHNDNR